MIKEKIAFFDPFEMEAFSCPVCGSTEFVLLTPYGGVWCANCNAGFEVKGTCDGLRKVAVRCITEHCWKKEYRDKAEFYATTIWEEDKEISWFAIKDKQIIR